MAKLLASTFPVAPGDRNGSDMRKRRGAPSHLCPVIGNPGYSFQIALGSTSRLSERPRDRTNDSRDEFPDGQGVRTADSPGDYSLMSEHQIQVALFKAYKQRRELAAIMFAIPNGGERRDAASGRQLKLEGVTAGAPDIFCCVNGRAFLIELKRVDGILSVAQRKFHKELVTAGIRVIVCKGFLEAVHTLEAEGVIRLPEMHRSRRYDDEDKGGAPAQVCFADRSRSRCGRAGVAKGASFRTA